MKEYTKLNDILLDLRKRQCRIERAREKNCKIRQDFDIFCENCRRTGGCLDIWPLCFLPNKEWVETHKEIEVTK